MMRLGRGLMSLCVVLGGACRAEEAVSSPEPVEVRLELRSDTTFQCTVTGVHDGDGPIYCRELDVQGKPVKIRLNGIAARELDETCRPGHPCPTASGADAKAALSTLVSGRVLDCRSVGKSFSRVVAICLAGGKDVSCSMVASRTALRWPRHDPQGLLESC